VHVLVTGAGGALGRDVVAALAGHDVQAFDHAALDVANRRAVLDCITSAQPEAVVHAAAWTDVDGCERDPDRAFAVNALGTRHVAEAARVVGAWTCYVSTDYVFDGTATVPYREWDTVNPLSIYGRSKLGGEREVAAASAGEATVVRTSWVAGASGRNFVRTILTRAADGADMKVVDDQRGCPTFTPDLASMIVMLVTNRMPGTFHVTNQGETTWFGLAREVLALGGYREDLASPISTADLDPPRDAPRPSYSVLDNAALRLGGVPLLPDYHEPLERLVKEIV
jgi:dTDP-4-dehydrorhamnose reductase